MASKHPASRKRVGEAVKDCVLTSEVFAMEGLGTFRCCGSGDYTFEVEPNPKVFIAYVEENLPAATQVFNHLRDAGLDPWLDKQKLLPGQNWPRAIERAISISDFFIPCFSKHAVQKRSTFHRELRHALNCADELPLEDTFIIPVRLDGCEVPKRITRHFQYVDLFPDLEKGMRKVLAAIRKQSATQHRRLLDLAD